MVSVSCEQFRVTASFTQTSPPRRASVYAHHLACISSTRGSANCNAATSAPGALLSCADACRACDRSLRTDGNNLCSAKKRSAACYSAIQVRMRRKARYRACKRRRVQMAHSVLSTVSINNNNGSGNSNLPTPYYGPNRCQQLRNKSVARICEVQHQQNAMLLRIALVHCILIIIKTIILLFAGAPKS